MPRKLSELRGETDAANGLAAWLRALTIDITVQQLKNDFPYRDKNDWTVFRNGSQLIPEDLLEAVVRKYIREPRLQGQKIREGRNLLAVARQAHRNRQSGQLATWSDRASPETYRKLEEAWRRLDDARAQQLDAMHKLVASQDKCRLLEDLVSSLQHRCETLEQERDRAREEARAQLQQELDLSLTYRHDAGDKLRHARRAREAAHELRLAAERKVLREQATVADTAPLPPEDEDQPTYLPVMATLPTMDKVKAVLDAAGEQLAEQDQALDDLRHQIDATPDESAPDLTILCGETLVVCGQPADNDETLDQPPRNLSDPPIAEETGEAPPEQPEAQPTQGLADAERVGEWVVQEVRPYDDESLSYAPLSAKSRAYESRANKSLSYTPLSAKSRAYAPLAYTPLSIEVRAYDHQVTTATAADAGQNRWSASGQPWSEASRGAVIFAHVVSVLPPIASPVVVAGFIAGVEASPGPAIWKMLIYLVAAVCGLALFSIGATAIGLGSLGDLDASNKAEEESVAGGCVLATAILGTLTFGLGALLLGLFGLLPLDGLGRWFAGFVGLL